MAAKPTYEELEESLKKAESGIKEYRSLYNAATAIASNLSLKDVLTSIAKQIVKAFNFVGCTIELWHRERDEIEVLLDYSKLYPNEVEKPGKIYYLKEYPTTLKVLETGQTIQIQLDDPSADKAELEFMHEERIFSLMIVPLIGRNQVLGILEIFEQVKSRVYTSNEIRLAESLASQGAIAIENSLLYKNASDEIQKRKRTEEALRESEAKFRNVAEQSLVGVNLIQDDIFKYVNPKFAEIFGYTVEECLDDMPFRKLVYPEDLPIVEEQVKKRLESEVKSVHYTFRGLKKGGEIIYIEIFGSVTWIDGKPAAIGTILDITSRKEIEDALKTNEEKLKAILETIPDPIVMYNVQGHPKFLNPAFSRVFGWSLDELRGKQIPFVPEDQKEITTTKMKELFDFGKPVKVDSKRLTKEGLLLDVRISAALTKNSEGKNTGMVVSLSDITERKNLEKDRTKLILELEKLSTTDPLTGAKNRRYFNEAARKLFNLSIRHKRSLSALMLDIDNFKKVNDTYGHEFGDDVLKKVAQTCQKLVRKTDLSARYGGEEFCFFFPETNANEAFNLAEKLRAAIANLEMKANDRKFSITASFGISECIHDEDSLESLIKRSDEALYEAKRNGKNCAVICSL
jgi:diguanylate cyclase (GGDEF)-like protein/PAS domain S-box-containing protein